MEKYDITDYLKDDKELQKAVIEEFLKEIAEFKAYKDVNEDFKTAWEELKAENDRLKKDIRTEKIYSSQVEELEESLNHLKQENEQLKNCLQEIKEIAEEYLTDCQGFKCAAMEEIIQKITKAEEK